MLETHGIECFIRGQRPLGAVGGLTVQECWQSFFSSKVDISWQSPKHVRTLASEFCDSHADGKFWAKEGQESVFTSNLDDYDLNPVVVGIGHLV